MSVKVKDMNSPCEKCPACAGFPGYGNECAYWKPMPIFPILPIWPPLPPLPTFPEKGFKK
jgi:hypothetical protein